MKLTPQIKIEVENFTKIACYIDSDCPIGQLYDYSCALSALAIKQMQDAEAKKQAEAPKIEEVPPAEKSETTEV